MLLRDYIRQNKGEATRLARELGISLAYLGQMHSGHRPVPPKVAVRIEQLTRGSVRRWDMFPDDWRELWPELTRAKGAPAAPQREAA